MNDIAVLKYLKHLLVSEPLRETVLKSALLSLDLPVNSRGLDVGCGLGLATSLPVAMIGSDGHVTGLDENPVFIDQARSLADRTEFGLRITYEVGDAGQLPWDDNTFDWACSVDFVGYSFSDSTYLLKEMMRVVKPGGLLFIMAWSSQMLLPGSPGLEAGLNASPAGLAPFNAGVDPEGRNPSPATARRLFPGYYHWLRGIRANNCPH